MNREIRFRIWDTVLKTMMPDFDNWIDFHGNYWTTPDERWDTKNTEIVRGHNYILMQFTGLTDKNGKEIYEGDIVNFHSFLFAGYSDAGSPDGPDEVFEDMIGPVTFYEGSFGVDIGFGHVPLSAHDDIEVIGDIYRNPELIKQLSK